MSDQIKMTVTLQSDPKTIYEAWFDSDKHTEFSGKNVQIEKKVGSKFFAQGGEVEGKIIKMIRNREIIQSWNWNDEIIDAEDTQVEISLEPVKDSTKMIVVHKNLPDGEGKKLRKEWRDKYFNPMKKYFAG